MSAIRQHTYIHTCVSIWYSRDVHADVVNKPSTLSRLSCEPSTLSRLSCEPSTLSRLSCEPSTLSRLPCEPSTLSRLSCELSGYVCVRVFLCVYVCFALTERYIVYINMQVATSTLLAHARAQSPNASSPQRYICIVTQTPYVCASSLKCFLLSLKRRMSHTCVHTHKYIYTS